MSAQITQLTCQLACRVLSRVYKVDSNGAHHQLLSTSENGCSSVSALVKMPHCWKSHVIDHCFLFYVLFLCLVQYEKITLKK